MKLWFSSVSQVLVLDFSFLNLLFFSHVFFPSVIFNEHLDHVTKSLVSMFQFHTGLAANLDT